MKENEDVTVTLTVKAVCDMVICDDAVITHGLAVMLAEDCKSECRIKGYAAYRHKTQEKRLWVKSDL